MCLYFIINTLAHYVFMCLFMCLLCISTGRLGLGSEDDYSTPQMIEFRRKKLIQSVCAGPDGTFLIMANGRVMACGSNEDNRLGFNTKTLGVKRLKKVKNIINLNSKIINTNNTNANTKTFGVKQLKNVKNNFILSLYTQHLCRE